MESDLNESPLQQLAPQFVRTERIAGWLIVGPIIAIGLIALTIGSFFLFYSFLWVALLWVGGVVIGLGLIWLIHVLPDKVYRTTFWRMSDAGFEIRRGIWWKHVISIPRSRVQHTDVAQGPLMRKWGLAKLVVHTAGTADSSVELNGLSLEVAQRLRDALVVNLRADHVHSE